MARKYSKYEIKVTFLNGDTEDIKLNGINKGSYKEMLQVYQQVKDQYSNTECKIDFVGIGQAGELGVLFTKEFKINEKPLFQLEAEQYVNTTMPELLEQLYSTIENIKKRGEWLENERDITNKLLDIEMHKIENFKLYSNNRNRLEVLEEKERIFDEVEKLRNNRRLIKKDMETFEEYKRACNYNTVNLKKIVDVRNYNDGIKQQYLTPKVLENKKILKCVTYNSLEEKEQATIKLKTRYNKIVYNDAEKTAYGYNKANNAM